MNMCQNLLKLVVSRQSYCNNTLWLTFIWATLYTGRRISSVTEDTRETVFVFRCLSVALQRGNAVSFLATLANSEL